MTELKIEVGKLYFDEATKEKLIYLGFWDEAYNFFRYKAKRDIRYSHHDLMDLKPWQEEPRVGWVYEDKYSNITHYKILADRKNFNTLETNRLVLINIKSGEVEIAGVDKLKLETGRPAEDV